MALNDGTTHKVLEVKQSGFTTRVLVYVPERHQDTMKTQLGNLAFMDGVVFSLEFSETYARVTLVGRSDEIARCLAYLRRHEEAQPL